MSKWYQNGVEGIKVLMRILVGQCTRPDHNLTIYDETKFSSSHTPYINSILHLASSYYFLSHKKLFQAGNFNVNVRPDLLHFSMWGVYSKTYQKHNLWPMKTAKTLCTSSRRVVWWNVIHSTKISAVLLALKAKGQKVLNAPRINERLQNYSDEYEIICENQAGFRKGYLTTDNLFILHTLTTLTKHNRKKLFCLFIDFEKAFEKVWRNRLWNKMMINSINGKMFSVIYNMYKCIKSRIVHNANVSEYFSCKVGLRQGENLSPFLFSLYLNDLEEFMYARNVIGLESVSRDLEDDLNVFLKLFILLYADNTVLFSESITDLQLQLNVFKEYCDLWKLKVNVSKTKALVFSKGQLSKNLSLYFGNDKIEFVNNFNYLGLIFQEDSHLNIH